MQEEKGAQKTILGYDISAARGFVRMYGNFTGIDFTVTDNLLLDDDVDYIFGMAGLDDSQRSLVERRYGLRDGIVHPEKFVGKNYRATLDSLTKLDEWAMTQRKSRKKSA